MKGHCICIHIRTGTHDKACLTSLKLTFCGPYICSVHTLLQTLNDSKHHFHNSHMFWVFFFLNITKLEEDIITVAVFILLATAVKLIKKRKRVHRQIWTSLWVQRRAVHGAHNSLLHELCLEDPSTLKKFVLIDQQCFAKL